MELEEKATEFEKRELKEHRMRFGLRSIIERKTEF